MSTLPNPQKTTVNPQSLKTRKQIAEEINGALTRFPLIVRILGELNQSPVPLAGDDDIRHGCERALTGMLSELSRIEIAPPGKTSKAEETAQNWLNASVTSELVDVDKLQRMQQFIDCILNSANR